MSWKNKNEIRKTPPLFFVALPLSLPRPFSVFPLTPATPGIESEVKYGIIGSQMRQKRIKQKANQFSSCRLVCLTRVVWPAMLLPHVARTRRAHSPSHAAWALGTALLLIARAARWRGRALVVGTHWSAVGRRLATVMSTTHGSRSVRSVMRGATVVHARVRGIARARRVDRRTPVAVRRRTGLNGASRQAGTGNNALLRAVKANAQCLERLALISTYTEQMKLTQPSSYSCKRRTS